MPAYLGEFEQLVLLAVMRLEDRATGAAIRDVIEEASHRTVWIGAVHTTLERAQVKRLVQARTVDPQGPGERRRKVYALTPAGRQALGRAYATWTRMTRGRKPALESL
jgi:PadR family transcriptional regulator, regulatory protein PadR